MKKQLRKIGKFLLKVVVIFLLTLFIFELVYRFQWVDFYHTEWKFLNPNKEQSLKKENRVLVFGDSFSSDANSWVNSWQKSSDSLAIFNSSVPGIGVETYNILIDSRVEEVKPKQIIIQLYVGNDLYDLNKPVNWSTFSIKRNLFWSTSNYFRGLNYVNYRLGQVSSDIDRSANPKIERRFDSKSYSSRTKLFINNIPNYPSSAIILEQGMDEDFSEMVDILRSFKEKYKDIPILILVIPHCTQVHESYISKYREMGAQIDESVMGENYWNKLLIENGFNVIDPLPVFRELETKGTVLYYENDPHLNEMGQNELLKIVKTNLKLN